MNAVQRGLLWVLAAELAVVGIWVYWRAAAPGPPQPSRVLLDATTANEIQDAAAKCVTAKDWRDLAETYMAAGCFRESEMCHRIACEKAPEDATLHRQWAFALERLAKLEEANAQYRRALELKAENPHACRYFIARNLLRMEKTEEAEKVFREGLALPSNRYELARLHLRKGELAEAETLFKELNQSQGNTLQVRLLGYRLAMERGDGAGAAKFSDALRYAPLKLQNPFDEEAERVVRRTPELGFGRVWQEVRDLLANQELDQVEARLKKLKVNDWHPTPSELWAQLHFQRGQHPEAIARFEELQAHEGTTARILTRIGDVWMAAGQPQKARDSWLAAVQLGAGANLPYLHGGIAQTFLVEKNTKDADWHRARQGYGMGREFLRIGQSGEAIEALAATVGIDAEFSQAWFYLGEAQRLAGRPQLAASAYRKCLELHPYHGRALASLALVAYNE